jgi:3'-phosphoadenosine 5'-phosphosulfate sulfotransferase (PAPS reductase)/FAD synthetase
MSRRTICWFSGGAASAVATKIAVREWPEAEVVYCDTSAEHDDNKRFMADCAKWFGRPITVIGSEEYADTWDVWERRKAMSFPHGAPCTLELKLKPRLAYQRPDDIQIFGYTADAGDVKRASGFRERFFEVDMRAPLIDAGVTKAGCLALLQDAKIEPPITYALGLPSANCIPCPKATSPNYWALIRKEWPDKFNRAAELSRSLGVRLTRINNERIFIDEIPADWPVTDAVAPACDFMCAIESQKIGKAA